MKTKINDAYVKAAKAKAEEANAEAQKEAEATKAEEANAEAQKEAEATKTEEDAAKAKAAEATCTNVKIKQKTIVKEIKNAIDLAELKKKYETAFNEKKKILKAEKDCELVQTEVPKLFQVTTEAYIKRKKELEEIVKKVQDFKTKITQVTELEELEEVKKTIAPQLEEIFKDITKIKSKAKQAKQAAVKEIVKVYNAREAELLCELKLNKETKEVETLIDETKKQDLEEMFNKKIKQLNEDEDNCKNGKFNALKEDLKRKYDKRLKQIEKEEEEKLKAKQPAPPAKQQQPAQPAQQQQPAQPAQQEVDKTVKYILEKFSGLEDTNDPKSALQQLVRQADSKPKTLKAAAMRVKKAAKNIGQANGGLNERDIEIFLYGYKGWTGTFGGATGTTKPEGITVPQMRQKIKELINPDKELTSSNDDDNNETSTPEPIDANDDETKTSKDNANTVRDENETPTTKPVNADDGKRKEVDDANKVKNLPRPQFSTDNEYAFLKIQGIDADIITYNNKRFDYSENYAQIVDIINVQGTKRGYGSKIIRSMLDSYVNKDYDLPDFIASTICSSTLFAYFVFKRGLGWF